MLNLIFFFLFSEEIAFVRKLLLFGYTRIVVEANDDASAIASEEKAKNDLSQKTVLFIMFRKILFIHL